MDNTRETSSNRAAVIASPSVVARGVSMETRGYRKQAMVRARKTAQDSKTSRRELNTGLANVCTGT